MIPADLAARLRLLNEASFFNTEPPVAGLQRAREIQAQLPELIPGQRFFATLQRTLPDGTFQALVAGKQVTLALNTSAKSGDTLELIVSETTPKAVFARLANPETAQGNSSAPSTLSQTGKLISFLLTGQPASKPVPLANNQPLLASPPANGAALVPVLRQAVAQSGLFYESHQAKWLSGLTDLPALQREPQAQFGAQIAQLAQRTASGAASSPAPPSNPAAPGSAAPVPGAATGSESSRSAGSILNAETSAVKTAPIPERTLNVVHQQLDALATQQYVWHGFAWPGQKIEWIVEDPRDEGGGSEGDELAEWNTTLRLTLPRLGGMEAQLHLTPAGVAVRLRADDPEAIKALEAGQAGLAEALEAVAVPLTGMVVEQRNGDG
ncbi:flagellar hook-length control protein FliK [Azoarcus sp. L1K30]|uniref:flagellar hook-length control protein FliK n=1 Tax=Azoarcus sp. L1K30 TaxID=2820277 RepID=UPI001B83669F|nr:flagellar hook-length control protein FliK [Azoarcus sp. L1K30]MBR0564540.1 flagellar hook-length control protein FliK [Azoarcus sp. L1K30]